VTEAGGGSGIDTGVDPMVSGGAAELVFDCLQFVEDGIATIEVCLD
jgi:hypothetical protein